MDRQTQLALAQRFRAVQAEGAVELAEAVYCNPVADYTSPDQWTRERASLFRTLPVLAGLSCDAAAPGDFFTLDLAGVPILVVRGDDGTLAAGFARRGVHRRHSSRRGTDKRTALQRGRDLGPPGRRDAGKR